jgi:hypothetical protein
LQTKNVKRSIFVIKNWPNENPWIGCKFSFYIFKFLERDIYLKEELNFFEGEFERDEVVKVQKFNK